MGVPEWLSGMTRNHVGFARAGSNPAAHVLLFLSQNHIAVTCMHLPLCSQLFYIEIIWQFIKASFETINKFVYLYSQVEFLHIFCT